MKLDLNQKNGIIELIAFVIGNRINDKATSLSYMELLDLKNVLRQDEPEEEKSMYILNEKGIQCNLSSNRFITLNERINDEELHEYYIIGREDMINDLIQWMSEAVGVNKAMMREDMEKLLTWDDNFILSSRLTNSYIGTDCSEFNETCKELIDINENL